MGIIYHYTPWLLPLQDWNFWALYTCANLGFIVYKITRLLTNIIFFSFGYGLRRWNIHIPSFFRIQFLVFFSEIGLLTLQASRNVITTSLRQSVKVTVIDTKIKAAKLCLNFKKSWCDGEELYFHIMYYLHFYKLYYTFVLLYTSLFSQNFSFTFLCESKIQGQ